MITEMSQLRHGMKVRGRLVNTHFDEGVIHLDGATGWAWVCQSAVAGNAPPDNHGFLYGWLIYSGELGRGPVELYPFLERGEAGKLRQDRVRLIRCMEKVLPKARQNGDEAALKRIIAMVRSDEAGHYLAYSQEQPDKISYASKPEHRFDNARRQRTTLGRYIRRQLEVGTDDLSEDGMQKLTRCIFAHLLKEPSAMIEIVTGENITDAYSKAIGGSSCMTGGDCRYVQLYEMNPDKVSLVIYGESVARALLWTCDDGQQVLDRIYPNDGAHVAVLHCWAEERGVVTRKGNSMPGRGMVSLSDYSARCVTLRHGDVFPYLDTFHFGTLLPGKQVRLSNDPDCEDVVFESAGGEYVDMEPEGVCCDRCGDRIDDGDEYAHDEACYCESCFNRLFRVCDRCNETVSADDVTCVDGDLTWCDDCASRHATRCDRCNERFSDSMTGVRDVDEIWCQSCTEDEAKECVDCGEYYHEDYHVCADGDVRCEDCASKCRECGDWRADAEIEDGLCPGCRTEDQAAPVAAEAGAAVPVVD